MISLLISISLSLPLLLRLVSWQQPIMLQHLGSHQLVHDVDSIWVLLHWLIHLTNQKEIPFTKLASIQLPTFPGQGVLLFGDKTKLARPSAFDRINVRRLFLGLERAIAIAARNVMFEFNDEFTRAEFKNIIEPFLERRSKAVVVSPTSGSV